MFPPADRHPCYRLLAFLVAGLLSGTPSRGAPAAPKGTPVDIVVESRRAVADRDRDAFEDALLLALVTSSCPVRPAEPGEKPALKAVVQLEKWREGQVPGGVNVYDYETGTTRRGVRREVEVRYAVRITATADGRLLRKAESRFVEVASTRKNPLWDPYVQSVERARRKASREILRWICRAQRKLARLEAKKKRTSR
ncbi:MAG: hypothetical protein Q9Q40_03480 [Acidobacteriota bacterium]|nr:hypothetical protein [Acidobacteriota bacterium]MDQ7086718.1 hypothetical protein [Acidobacteriota bacterium]